MQVDSSWVEMQMWRWGGAWARFGSAGFMYGGNMQATAAWTSPTYNLSSDGGFWVVPNSYLTACTATAAPSTFASLMRNSAVKKKAWKLSNITKRFYATTCGQPNGVWNSYIGVVGCLATACTTCIAANDGCGTAGAGDRSPNQALGAGMTYYVFVSAAAAGQTKLGTYQVAIRSY